MLVYQRVTWFCQISCDKYRSLAFKWAKYLQQVSVVACYLRVVSVLCVFPSMKHHTEELLGINLLDGVSIRRKGSRLHICESHAAIA